MKRSIFLLIIFLSSFYIEVSAQSYEAQQLMLDWTKLMQMKGILKDMKEGYQIVSKGYSTIRDISQGNFNLHKAFLDGLWLVSPAVQKYWKIPQIMRDQLALVKEYKEALHNYKGSDLLNPDELTYISNVYSNLVTQSLKDLGDLTTLLTADKLRMSDDERLSGVDNVYALIQDKLQFLRSFNNHNSILLIQRAKAQHEVSHLQSLYGINK